MKTKSIKGAIIAGLILFSLTAKPVTANIHPSGAVQKTIQEGIKSPAGAPGNQKIEVLFTTNENGNVNFVLAKTKDAGLRQEIEKQFYNMHFTGLHSNVVNSVVLNFKSI
jgi:hypothetical protein